MSQSTRVHNAHNQRRLSYSKCSYTFIASFPLVHTVSIALDHNENGFTPYSFVASLIQTSLHEYYSEFRRWHFKGRTNLNFLLWQNKPHCRTLNFCSDLNDVNYNFCENTDYRPLCFTLFHNSASLHSLSAWRQCTDGRVGCVQVIRYPMLTLITFK
jgi:hypothetical protein